MTLLQLSGSDARTLLVVVLNKMDALAWDAQPHDHVFDLLVFLLGHQVAQVAFRSPFAQVSPNLIFQPVCPRQNDLRLEIF